MIFLPLNFLHSILYFFRIKSTKSNVDDGFYLCTNFVQSSDFVQSPLFKSITKWQSIFPTSLSYLFTGQYSTEISLNQFIHENSQTNAFFRQKPQYLTSFYLSVLYNHGKPRLLREIQYRMISAEHSAQFDNSV